MFWTLLLAVWGALNAVFIGGDLFNLYVALELLTFAAVPLVSLDGRAETLAAALRYLLFALFGSILYLLGAVLLYGAYGTLDIVLLSSRIRAEPVAWAAISLMTAGLLAKAALYPFHLWLPPAHAGAPAPASAILSGLVVKAPFFLVVRLWFDVMPRMPEPAAAQVLGILGAAAILLGSVVALRQARLKLLIAYSTVAQIGYLFLMFPLAVNPETGHPWSTVAWTGGILQAISHAFAKAAMFMAAGLIAEALGHDRIAGLAGIGRALPITVFAFGLGGLSLMGLPPSGGFVAKAMLLTAAVAEGQWWWAVVILAGGLLAGGYVFLVLARALADPIEPLRLLDNHISEPAGGGRSAGAVRGAARLCAAAAFGAAADRPSRHGDSGVQVNRCPRPIWPDCRVVTAADGAARRYTGRTPRNAVGLSVAALPRPRAVAAGAGAGAGLGGGPAGPRRHDLGPARAAVSHDAGARRARGDAARGRGAAVDRRGRLRLGPSARRPECRTLCGVVAADADRQPRRLHRRRPGELLSDLLRGQSGGLWPDRT